MCISKVSIITGISPFTSSARDILQSAVLKYLEPVLQSIREYSLPNKTLT
jgi:hypothetical protein